MMPSDNTLSLCSFIPNPSVAFRSLYYRQRASGWNAPRRPCHPPKPQTPQRRQTFTKQPVPIRTGPWMSLHSLVFTTLLVFYLSCQKVEAGNARSMYRPGRQNELLFDNRKPPIPGMDLKPGIESNLQSRNSLSDSSSPDFNRDETTGNPKITLPSPFDGNLGNNFTSPSCPAFFEKFLHNASFQDCLPFSLLLQTSSEFFTISRSLVELTETLDATCNVDYQQCSTLMSSLAEQIQTTENCGPDFQMRNPIVEEAYNGFMAYQPLYHAGCMKDSGGEYCFADAVTNTSAPSGSFIYYLPLGIPLPGGSQLTCNTCLQNTMEVFKKYTTPNNQALSSDYSLAAQQVDMTCGPRFVESSVQMSSAAQTTPRGGGLLSFGFLILLFYLFLG